MEGTIRTSQIGDIVYETIRNTIVEHKLLSKELDIKDPNRCIISVLRNDNTTSGKSVVHLNCTSFEIRFNYSMYPVNIYLHKTKAESVRRSNILQYYQECVDKVNKSNRELQEFVEKYMKDLVLTQ